MQSWIVTLELPIGLVLTAVGDGSSSRQQSTVFGEDAYPTTLLKAAALLHSIARNRALVDGNMRLAWLAMVVFLDLNGNETQLSDDEAFDLVWSVAAGELEVAEIARRLSVRNARNARRKR